MFKIRKGVFETNSSSCHCLQIAPKGLFDKLLNHECFYCGDIQYDSDYPFFVNNFEEKYCIDRERFLILLRDFLEREFKRDENADAIIAFKDIEITKDNIDKIIEIFKKDCCLSMDFERQVINNNNLKDFNIFVDDYIGENATTLKEFETIDGKEVKLVIVHC
jgi:hypothetical protein